MEEPSVLDYVKAKLRFWEKTDLRIPLPPELPSRPEEETAAPVLYGDTGESAQPALVDGTLTSTSVAADASGDGRAAATEAEWALQGQGLAGAHPAQARPAEAVRLPWLVLIPPALALIAQTFLEPPGQSIGPAIFCYVLAAFTAGFAFWRGVLRPVQLAPAQTRVDDMAYRWGEAAIAAPLAVMAFMLFTRNRFTGLNLTLWLLSMGLFVYAFLDTRGWGDLRGRLRGAAAALVKPGGGWNVRLTGWTLLLLAVLALVGYFRFFQLDLLPVDMVSDHAEKLLDVNDVVNGQYPIFFERNTGREWFQFYWTALVAQLFGTGVTFFSLKLGTALAGVITLFYVYRLGGLLGNRWVALLALVLVGVSYWANIISRIALRFPLYPLFVAPLLYHLIRGLRNGTRNDFIWAGLWLGIGLNGYTSSRIVPFLVVLAFGLYMLHRRSKDERLQSISWLLLVAFFALLVCLPLFRYGLEHPDAVLYRSLTRIGEAERTLDGSPLQIFLGNLWAAMTMFFYNNGSIWVHSIPFRPALDVVSAAFFFLGVVLLLARYVKERSWEDILLLVSVPVLLLPSALSLAFPGENPSLNRTSGAYVPVLVIAALGIEALARGLAKGLPGKAGIAAAALVGALLLTWTVSNNHNLFFVQYNQNYKASSWNTREIGAVVRDFAGLARTYDTYYVVGFPYWIDSRQVAIFAGHIERDAAILPEGFANTVEDPRMKLFILKPEDTDSLDQLRMIYPQGRADLRKSEQEGKDFVTFLVPALQESLP